MLFNCKFILVDCSNKPKFVYFLIIFLFYTSLKKYIIISNLATQQPALSNEVYVHGYSTPVDGGGYFAWKTTTELPAGAAANTGIWLQAQSEEVYGKGSSQKKVQSTYNGLVLKGII